MSFIVAIDGPAGTGKGTVTEKLSRKLGLINIDTGATYRAVTLAMIDEKISLEEIDKINTLLENIKIELKNQKGKQSVFLNGQDVTEKIRSKEVTKLVSQVSSIKEVRFAMAGLQRKMAEGKSVIMEGRDIGTYVFPGADVKIYLDAEVEERAKRRYKENQEKGNKTPYEWFGKTEKWDAYETYINHLMISQKKKDNYLLKKLDFEMEREMRNQNLNDTKYISRELSSLIKAYLNVEKVNMYPGAITSKLRARWGFNKLTHSYISKTYRLPEEMKKDINKDRDNHLHHAMDALVIASITPSLQQKITLYEKFSRYIDGLTELQIKNIPYIKIDDSEGQYYNDNTGEIETIDIKDYIKEQLANNNIYYNKHNISKLEFPLPYEGFDEEAKLRVYEQDLDTLKWNLQSYNTYTKKDIESLHTLIPSIAKSKISGKMHEETYYGIKEFGKNEDKKVYKTLRTPIEKVKRKDLENIPDKSGGSKEIYETLVEWFGDYEVGEEVLKANGNKYPVSKNDKEHKEIRKLKLYSEYKNTGHMINHSNVEKGGIYRVDIFKSKDQDDDKLYFAAYDILEIKKINTLREKKMTDDTFTIKLDYGQGKNNRIISYTDIVNHYDLYLTLNKNDLIKVITKDGKESIAYVVGCSSGMFEVKSKLGDGYDIIVNSFNENNIFNKQRKQYAITVSTIKKVKKLSISVLGEISGL